MNKKLIGEYTTILWSSVSISRSQFEDHYIQTIKNVGTYMQDSDALSVVLRKASEAVRGTMLLKLPYNRSREEGGKYEQMWKYTMFCCHMLQGTGEVSRRFYDSNGKRLLVMPNSRDGVFYYDDGGDNPRYLLSHNVSALLPHCSIEWLLRDQERGLVEVSRAAMGLDCFIDRAPSTHVGEYSDSLPTLKSAPAEMTRLPKKEGKGGKPKKPSVLETDESDITLEVNASDKGIPSKKIQMPNKSKTSALEIDKTHKTAQAKTTPVKKGESPKQPKPAAVKRDEREMTSLANVIEQSVNKPTVKTSAVIQKGKPKGMEIVDGITKIQGVPPLKTFKRWVKSQQLAIDPESEKKYIELPEGIDRFLTEKNAECSSIVYTAKLKSHGYLSAKITVKNSNKSVLLIPETSNV